MTKIPGYRQLNEKLGDLATTEEVTADNVKIKVEQGDCLWEIGNALGIDWQTIAEQNGTKVHTLFTQIRNLQFRWIQ